MSRATWVTVLLLVSFLAAFVLAGFFSYRLYQVGQLGVLIPKKISVFSEIEGVGAKLNNKAGLEELLDYLGFWDGVRLGYKGELQDFITPQKLIIHITDNEYRDTWFVDKNGDYDSSAKAEGRANGTFHLYLGFNPRVVEKGEKLSESADFVIFEALYKRTKGAYDQEGLDLRNAKSETEPYLDLYKK